MLHRRCLGLLADPGVAAAWNGSARTLAAVEFSTRALSVVVGLAVVFIVLGLGRAPAVVRHGGQRTALGGAVRSHAGLAIATTTATTSTPATAP